jgi:hypothetical protein
MSYAQIADRLGKSKGYVQNRLRLLQLDDDLRKLVADRPDTLSHVYELSKIGDRERRRPLVEAVREGALSFHETRARVHAITNPLPSRQQRASPPAVLEQPATAERTAVEEQPAAPEQRTSAQQPAPPDQGGALGGADTSSPTPDHGDSRAGLAPAEAPASAYQRLSGGLSARERASLEAIIARLIELRADPGRLTPADWAVLDPLGELLIELAQARGGHSGGGRNR